jgi:hypothetical protein
MGLSQQTVANHMSLAMADLRASLKPYFEMPDRSSGEDAASRLESNDG